MRGEDKIRWGTRGFATYLRSLYLSSNVQDQPPRPLARRGGNAHGISVNLISSRRASPSTQTVDQLAVLHAHKVHDLELSDEDAPLKSPKKKGNGRRALSAEADISNGVTIQTSHMHLETRVALLAQVAEAKPHCGDGGQDRAVLPHRSLDHRHVLE